MRLLMYLQFIPLFIAQNHESIIVQLIVSITTLIIYYAKRSFDKKNDRCRTCIYKHNFNNKINKDE